VRLQWHRQQQQRHQQQQQQQHHPRMLGPAPCPKGRRSGRPSAGRPVPAADHCGHQTRGASPGWKASVRPWRHR
jgi:hypothetical protein